MHFRTELNRWRRLALLLSAWALVGCDVPIESFSPNRVYVAKLEQSQSVELSAASVDAQAALERLFGTPDQPLWPDFLKEEHPELFGIVNLDRLTQAAGAVRSDEQDVHYGLFREHCVACHGISGNGQGPTSRFLNPYPRDFRLGKFKFKSTPIGKKPTRADLHQLLEAGIAGTSMPSFRLLKQAEREALSDYVIYLSVRGEVERQLMSAAAFQLDYEAGDRLYDADAQLSTPDKFAQQWDMLKQTTIQVCRSWHETLDNEQPLPAPPAGYPLFNGEQPQAANNARLAASIANGRKLFQGPIANCASCHGPTGIGDGPTKNYDAWTKDWSEGIDLQDKSQVAPWLKLGALKPVPILPRNLRTGVHRGGSRPADLYWRIVHGIDGTPMPAAALQPANPQGLTQEEVWDLVNFLLSLPGEQRSPTPDNTQAVTTQTHPHGAAT